MTVEGLEATAASEAPTEAAQRARANSSSLKRSEAFLRPRRDPNGHDGNFGRRSLHENKSWSNRRRNRDFAAASLRVRNKYERISLVRGPLFCLVALLWASYSFSRFRWPKNCNADQFLSFSFDARKNSGFYKTECVFVQARAE